MSVRPRLTGILSGLAVALLVPLLLYRQVDGPPPPLVTCSQLTDQPVAHAGRVVRVSTAGCQKDGPKRLVWRARSPGPPDVVLTFTHPVPDPIPDEVTGNCHAPKKGGPVTVTECQP